MTLAHLGHLSDLGRRVLPARTRRLRLVDVLMLGPGNRLAVVTFGDRELLIAVGKGQLSLLAETVV